MLAAMDARNAIRDQVLELTSAFRTTAAEAAGDLSDPAAFETLRRTGQRLGETARQAGVDPLLHPARLLERGPAIAAALCAAQPAEARAVLAATQDVLGTTEQLLDWCLEVVDTERQSRLLACLERSFPERWRPLLDGDVESFQHQLEAYAPPAAAAAPAALAVARELLQAFDEEANDRLRRAEELLVQLERRPGDDDLMNELFRQFHTLKGAAAEIGIDAARSQLHEAESILAAARDGTTKVAPAALAQFFFRLIDSVRALIDQANGRPTKPGAVIADVAAEIARLTGQKRIDKTTPDGPATSMQAEQPLLAQLREKLSSTEQNDEVLRLIEALEQQVSQRSQAGTETQEQLDELRAVPLQSMLRRLLRPVRDAARQEGKLVELELRGGDIRADREIVERLHGPLLHIARNAVSHGIEAPPVRQAAGKTPTGNLRVHAQRNNGHLVVTVMDDGAGLDYEAIHAKASAQGWIEPGRFPSRHELARFILRPGFSTKEEVTDLAGRGVGMDVVAREIDTLNGHIDIESLDGRGTSIRLTVPLPSA